MADIVMIIGGGIFQVPAIREAKQKGYAVLVLDLNPEAPGFADADFKEYISTKDVAGAIACAQAYSARHVLKAVFTAGTDAAYTVACVADALGLPGIPPDAAFCATNKYVMRCALAQHHVPCPAFGVAASLASAREIADRLAYPLVIKPVDNMGARGVRRIDSDQELGEAFAASIRWSGNYSTPAVIIEEYMPGDEISMDTLVDEQGTVHLLTIADRHIVSPPYFVERGHSVPSELPAPVLTQAFEVMKQAIRAVGITRGAAKADIKITPTGAKIGEITARLSGGFHSQYTDPLATGMRSTKAALDIALGLPLDTRDITPRWQRVAIERALVPSPGRISSIQGISEARAVPGVCEVFMTARVGDDILPLTSNIGKAGHVIACGQTRREAEAAADEARRRIVIHTEAHAEVAL